ncbi:hypothetical protein H0H93_001870 [Arthromyces matolae]|nr:hypothetical protein H0H93_001870 [Arthromyces matolae]
MSVWLLKIELFHHSRDVPATVTKLTCTLDRSTGKVLKKGPRVLTKGISAEVEITLRTTSLSGPATARPIPLEPFTVNKDMGRILIRRGGETIGAAMADSLSPPPVIRQRAFNGPPIDIEKATNAGRPEGVSARSRLTLNTSNTGATAAAMRQLEELEAGLSRFWNRFRRRGKPNVPIGASLRAIAFSSWLNIFVIFLPLAWVGHFLKKQNEDGEWVTVFPPSLTFTFCFLALVPLEWLFDWGGEQMEFYLGHQLGDLVVITLNNSTADKTTPSVVEATLAILLLLRCELVTLPVITKLMQSTVVGVVILHLLFIPGASFITGGARVMQQELHAHMTELNHTLLVMGVLSLLLPSAFFAGMNHGVLREITSELAIGTLINDDTRDRFLVMSRGLAIILLALYIGSRIYLHNPPGRQPSIILDIHTPAALKEQEKTLLLKEPKANQYVLIVVLAVSIAIMAATTEWLVESIEFVRESTQIKQEWFGMILLPIVSWAANGFVTIVYFIRYMFRHFFKEPAPPTELAQARAIDLSIQFTLFWMPFLVMLGWWTNKPMHLLFDIFEVAVLIGSCFVVNYVTADSKTNWAEGFAMVSFYLMIVSGLNEKEAIQHKMEENKHRQRALEALTRNSISGSGSIRPKSSSSGAPNPPQLPATFDSGHSIWSDDAASTRRIPFPGGIDSRFNNVDLGNPTTPVRTASRALSVHVTGPDNRGVEVIWDAHHETDAESQYSNSDTVAEQGNRPGRFSRFLKKPISFWHRLRGDGREKIGWMASFKAFATHTWLNILLIFVPIAWGVHYSHVSHIAKFMMTFIAIIPLSKILDYGGEQLAMYCGRAIGDLIVITLNNAVETVLAVVLLMHCDLKLLQSTVIGVVLLRLLLVPGSAFMTGGANVFAQELHPHVVQLNNALLTMGALTLLLPAAYFSGLDRMVPPGTVGVAAAISDTVRGELLKISRALALFLLVV